MFRNFFNLCRRYKYTYINKKCINIVIVYNKYIFNREVTWITAFKVINKYII